MTRWTALAEGRLAGAAIDAYRTEPSDRAAPIFRNPRVIFTPHSGADTKGSFRRMGRMIPDDIATILAGAVPPSLPIPNSARPPSRRAGPILIDIPA